MQDANVYNINAASSPACLNTVLNPGRICSSLFEYPILVAKNRSILFLICEKKDANFSIHLVRNFLGWKHVPEPDCRPDTLQSCIDTRSSFLSIPDSAGDHSNPLETDKLLKVSSTKECESVQSLRDAIMQNYMHAIETLYQPLMYAIYA